MSNQKNKYTLTENTTDGVMFDLRGNQYFLRYPVVSEVETIQDLSEGIEDSAQLKKDNPDEYKRRNDELEDFLFGLITPVDHELNIKDELQKENVKVYRNFNTMIKTELSLN